MSDYIAGEVRNGVVHLYNYEEGADPEVALHVPIRSITSVRNVWQSAVVYLTIAGCGSQVCIRFKGDPFGEKQAEFVDQITSALEREYETS